MKKKLVFLIGLILILTSLSVYSVTIWEEDFDTTWEFYTHPTFPNETYNFANNPERNYTTGGGCSNGVPASSCSSPLNDTFAMNSNGSVTTNSGGYTIRNVTINMSNYAYTTYYVTLRGTADTTPTINPLIISLQRRNTGGTCCDATEEIGIKVDSDWTSISNYNPSPIANVEDCTHPNLNLLDGNNHTIVFNIKWNSFPRRYAFSVDGYFNCSDKSLGDYDKANSAFALYKRYGTGTQVNWAVLDFSITTDDVGIDFSNNTPEDYPCTEDYQCGSGHCDDIVLKCRLGLQGEYCSANEQCHSERCWDTSCVGGGTISEFVYQIGVWFGSDSLSTDFLSFLFIIAIALILISVFKKHAYYPVLAWFLLGVVAFTIFGLLRPFWFLFVVIFMMFYLVMRIYLHAKD